MTDAQAKKGRPTPSRKETKIVQANRTARERQFHGDSQAAAFSAIKERRRLDEKAALLAGDVEPDPEYVVKHEGKSRQQRRKPGHDKEGPDAHDH